MPLLGCFLFILSVFGCICRGLNGFTPRFALQMAQEKKPNPVCRNLKRNDSIFEVKVETLIEPGWTESVPVGVDSLEIKSYADSDTVTQTLARHLICVSGCEV